MSGTSQINDPLGVSGIGNTPVQPQTIFDIPASVAVTRKMLVALVMNADGVLTVAPATTGSHSTQAKVGVALNSAAINENVQVVVFGVAEVITPAAGPSISSPMVISSTAGTAGFNVTPDATTITGIIKGVFLTDEIGTGDTSWVFVNG
jgi:hypothetical protein